MKKNNKGFTLIELLVAVAIMLSLLGIAIVNFINISDKKKEESWESVKSQIETAAEQYFKSNEYLFEGLTTTGENITGTISLGKLVNEDYLNAVTDPRTGKMVSYCTKVNVTRTSNGVFIVKIDELTTKIDDRSYTDAQKAACDTDNSVIVSEVGAPEFTIKKSGPQKDKNSGWYTGEVELKLDYDPTNENNNIVSSECKTGDNECSDYDSTNKTAIQWSETTGTTYCFTLKNNKNKTSIGCDTVKIDKTAPNCPTVTVLGTEGSGEWYKKGTVKYTENGTNYYFALKITPTKDTKYWKWYTNNGENYVYWSDNEGVKTKTLGDGNRKVKTVAYDEAGNSENNCTSSYKIDTVFPTFNVGLYEKTNTKDVNSESGLSNYTSGDWYNKGVFTKAMNRNDATSGIDTTTYTTTGAVGSNSKTSGYYYNINPEGTSTIQYTVCDKAGNCTNSSNYTIKLDRTAPTGTLTVSSDVAGYNYNKVDISMTANDGISGVATVNYSDRTGNESYNVNNNSGVQWNNSINSRILFSSLTKSTQTDTPKIVIADQAGNTKTISKSYSTYALCSETTKNGVDKGEQMCDSTTGKYTWTETQLYKDKYVSGTACSSGDPVKKTGDSCQRTCNITITGTKGDGVWYKKGNITLSNGADDNYWTWYVDDKNQGITTKTISNDTYVKEGTHTYKIKGKNGEECSESISYDNTNPECPSVDPDGEKGDNGWYKKGTCKEKLADGTCNSYFGLKVTPSSDTVQWDWLTNNNSGGMNNNATIKGKKEVYLGPGKRTAKVIPYDAAGNSNDTCTYNYNIDIEAPSLNYIDSGDNYNISNDLYKQFDNTVLNADKNLKNKVLLLGWHYDGSPYLAGFVNVTNNNFTVCIPNDKNTSTGKKGGYYISYSYNFSDSHSGVSTIDYNELAACNRPNSPCNLSLSAEVCDYAGNCRTVSTSYKAVYILKAGHTNTNSTCNVDNYNNSFSNILFNKYSTMPNTNP